MLKELVKRRKRSMFQKSD